MAGPNDPHGPKEPRRPHGRRGGQGHQGQHHEQPEQHGRRERPDPGQGPELGPEQRPDRGAYGTPRHDGPFEPFEPVRGYGSAARYPDPREESGTYVPEKRANGYDHDRPPRRLRRVSFVRLWAGGVVVALVAALAAVVALLLVRDVLDITVFAPGQEGTMEITSAGELALGSALAALAATAVLSLLMLATPQPVRFLGWIVALGTAAVMLLPFTSDASWAAKGGTAGVYLVIGLVIGTLLATVARTATAGGDDRG